MIDGTDAEDITGLVTQLLLQIVPTTVEGRAIEVRDSDYHQSARQPVCDSADTSNHAASNKHLETREQAGCHLWDMTSSHLAAMIAVKHAAFDILPKVVSQALGQEQTRLAEVLIGSLANILCHPDLAELVS